MLCLTILYAVSGLLLHAAEVTPALTPWSRRRRDRLARRRPAWPAADRRTVRPLVPGVAHGAGRSHGGHDAARRPRAEPPARRTVGGRPRAGPPPPRPYRRRHPRPVHRSAGQALDLLVPTATRSSDTGASTGCAWQPAIRSATRRPSATPFERSSRPARGTAGTRHSSGARTDHLWIYQQLGLRTLYLGDEAVIDVGDFSLRGRRMRNTRQAVHHADRAGATTQVIPEPTARRRPAPHAPSHRRCPAS